MGDNKFLLYLRVCGMLYGVCDPVLPDGQALAII